MVHKPRRPQDDVGCEPGPCLFGLHQHRRCKPKEKGGMHATVPEDIATERGRCIGQVLTEKRNADTQTQEREPQRVFVAVLFGHPYQQDPSRETREEKEEDSMVHLFLGYYKNSMPFVWEEVTVAEEKSYVLVLPLEIYLSDFGFDTNRDLVQQSSVDLPRLKCFVEETPTSDLPDFLTLMRYYEFSPFQRTVALHLATQNSLALGYECAMTVLNDPTLHLGSWNTPQECVLCQDSMQVSKTFRVLRMDDEENVCVCGTVTISVDISDPSKDTTAKIRVTLNEDV